MFGGLCSLKNGGIGWVQCFQVLESADFEGGLIAILA